MASCFLLQSETEVRCVEKEPLSSCEEVAVDSEEFHLEEEMDMETDWEVVGTLELGALGGASERTGDGGSCGAGVDLLARLAVNLSVIFLSSIQ